MLEAVNRFRQRRPETVLVCLWGNPWLDGSFVKLMDRSPHHPGFLDHLGESGIDWMSLFASVGMTNEHARVYETIDNRMLPMVMREADVALFPNRCEGGTNMMAMQTMACGVPTILSANTGHMDIIEDGACLALQRQGPVVVDHPEISTEGWGESDIDEIVDPLEGGYQDREKAREIGMASADLMARHSWKTRIEELAPLIGL